MNNFNFNDLKEVDNFFFLVESMNVPEIPSHVNFWLVRSEGGLLYEEYVSESFIAIGWNKLTPSKIIESIKDKEKKEEVLNEISEEYNTERPGTIFNKADRFINKMKSGDIVMIPDKSNENITFAYIQDYYEEHNNTITEAEFKALRESGWEDSLNGCKCPFIKRRKIKILKSVSNNKVNPNLFKALISYHGISDINEYADEILSSIFPIYIHNDQINLVFYIKNENNIDSVAFSSLIYNSSIQLNKFGRPTIKSNINSPGISSLGVGNFINYGKAIFPNILIIYIAITGGKIFGIEFKSIIQSICEKMESNANIELTQANTRKINAEAEAIEIDNTMKKRELQIKQKELEELVNIPTDIDIESEEFLNIIDFEKYYEKKIEKK